MANARTQARRHGSDVVLCLDSSDVPLLDGDADDDVPLLQGSTTPRSGPFHKTAQVAANTWMKKAKIPRRVPSSVLTSADRQANPDTGEKIDLDNKLWSWVDEDKAAQDSAIFTNAGVVASPRAHILLAAVAVVCVVSALVRHYSQSLVHGPWAENAALLALGCELVVVGVLIKLKRPQAALVIWRYGAVVPVVIASLVLLCQCSCTLQRDDEFCGLKMFTEHMGSIANDTGRVTTAEAFARKHPMHLVCVMEMHNGTAGPSPTEEGGGGEVGVEKAFNTWLPCAASWGWTLTYALCGCVINVFLRWSVPALLALFTAVFSFAFVIAGFGDDYAIGCISLLTAMALAAATLFVVRRRRQAVARAYRLVEDQRCTYDRLWQDHVRHEGEELATLARVWGNVACGFNRGTLSQPVNRLAELFEEADAVNEWFQNHAYHWAATVSEQSRQRWGHVGVKGHDRAIEKIRRTYFGRVSRAFDIVRASVVCDTIKEVHELLHHISKDEAVVVLRGKQRFTTAYDARASGGYRDLQLSVQLVGAEVQLDEEGLYCSTAAIEESCRKHIAEVQIHLRDIYDAKTTACNTKGPHHDAVAFRLLSRLVLGP